MKKAATAATAADLKKRKSRHLTKRETIDVGGVYGDFLDLPTDGLGDMNRDDILAALTGGAMKPSTVEPTKSKSSSRSSSSKKRRRRSSDKDKVDRQDQKAKDLLAEQVKLERKRAKKLGLMNLVRVPRALRKQFALSVHDRQKELYEFLLTTIAPIELAIDPAVSDAEESMRMMTGSQDVEISMTRARTILQDLVDLKTLEFMSDKLGLGPALRQVIIAKHFAAVPSPKPDGGQELLRKMLSQVKARPPLERPPVKDATSPVKNRRSK